MTPERWKQVKSVLEQAIEVPTTARGTFLDEACGDNAQLRREIESLLDYSETENDLLENNAFSEIFETSAATAKKPIFPGMEIGNYKILSELGAGGMGAVYLATRADGAFEQRAALKIVKRGMDSEAVLRRFFRERRILAALNHPNIARLMDGGTTPDGLPYFVMEYVEGETITEYATRKNLTLEDRLRLFREICAAVTFAHSNLVIHRDLKPSNILVTEDGSLKLLDFGIAKLLTNETDGGTVTQEEMQIFTPEYASPEQVRGEKLTTSTDIYSLGVLLYELLTGSRPYQTNSRNIGEIIRAVCETEPKPPSAAIWDLGFGISESKERSSNKKKFARSEINPKSQIPNPKLLKGDLDNVILKALRKESERRYSSVEKFSEDIRRHLAGLPVTASKDTWSYRASKFMQRNRLKVAAAGLIFLSLLGGLFATLYQAKAAQRERAKAEQRFNDVRKLANSFMFEINDEIMKSPVRARELLVQKALEYLDKLAAEAGDNRELQRELAASYEKIGEVQSQLFKPTTGKTSEALSSHRKALEIREKVFNAEPNAAHAIDLANSFVSIGDLFLVSGKLAESRGYYRAAIRLLEPQIVSAPQNHDIKLTLAGCLLSLGQADLRSGSLGEALENYEKGVEIYKTLVAENPDVTKYQRALGIAFSFIGFVKLEMGKTGEAVKDYQDWLDIEKPLFDLNDFRYYSYLSTANVWVGVALSEDGKMSQAFAHFTEGIRIQEKAFAADTGNLGEEYTLADCYLEFGKAAARNRLADTALENLSKALVIYRKIWQKDTQNLMARHRVANAQRFMADAFFQKGNLTQASENYEQSLVSFRELTAADAQNVDWEQDLAMNFLRLGELAVKKSDKPNALKNFEAALPIFEKLVARSPENVKRKKELENIRSLLARFNTQTVEINR